MRATLERVGYDRGSGRALLYLHALSPASLSVFRTPTPHFVCLLVWDSDEESVETISRVAEQLLESGCAYLCAWGAGCERVHDVFDEILVGEAPDTADGPEVMTTWHAHESLEDALWFFLRSTSPDGRYADTCRSGVVIVIGRADDEAAIVRHALAQPSDFSRRVERAGR